MSPLTSRIASFICGSCCSLPVHLTIYQRRRLARGEKQKDWRRWQAGMQYGIRSEQAIEKVGELFSVVASERQPRRVGRARSQAVPSKRITAITGISQCTISTPEPTLPSSVIQYSDGKQSVLNECVLITCASLYTFCNEFQVKTYDIITAFSGPPGRRCEAGPPDSQGWWSGGPLLQNVNFEPCWVTLQPNKCCVQDHTTTKQMPHTRSHYNQTNAAY